MSIITSSRSEQFEGKESRSLVALEWTLAVAAAAFQLFIAPHEIWGDGAIRYDTLVKLIDSGEVSRAKYSILHSFLAAPLYELGKLFGHGREFASYFNVILFHLTLILLFKMLRRHLAAPVLRRTILFLLAASMFGNHVQAFYGEVLTACAAILGFSALALNRPAIAGLAMCIAVINSPSAMLALVLCNGLWALRTHRWIQAVWPVIVSGMLIALEYWWRRGSPTRSGYEGDALGFTTILPYSGRPGFSYPLALGILSLLFSFGKGILFFAPGLLLCHVPTPDKRAPVVSMLAQLSIIFSGGILLVYASWWAWSGSVFWGPRFLLIACMPASFALARHISSSERKHVGITLLIVAAIIWSVWVGVNGTVIREGYADVCTANRVNYESVCWYIPEFSTLIHPLIVPRTLALWDKIYVLFGVVVASVLTVPFLARQVRDFAIRILSHGN